MPKSRQINNRLDIEGFPSNPCDLSKLDWIDLYRTLMAWGNRVVKRKLQQKDSPDTCKCDDPDNDMVPFGDHCLQCGGTIRR